MSNPKYVDDLYYFGTVEALTEVIQKYYNGPSEITLKALESVFIFVKAKDQCKEKANEVGLLKILDDSIIRNEEVQDENIKYLANTLYYQVSMEGQSMIFEDEIEDSFEPIKKEELTADLEVPQHLIDWSSKGTEVTIVNETCQKQKVWLFTSKDCKTISYKEQGKPDDQVLCSMKIKEIFNFAKGYQNVDISPFVKASKNDKLPTKSRCFTLIGAFSENARNHMHIICENSTDAQMWIQNIELLRKRKRLKQQKKYENLHGQIK